MLENIVDYINMFFMYYIFIYAAIFFISTIISIINLHEAVLRKKYSNNLSIKNKANYIPISILVPAYNEEKSIAECISSMLHLDYPDYEIVIINDGSNDRTAEIVIEEFKLKRVARPIRRLVNSKREVSIYEGGNKIKITLINKENGGKADALNLGINASRFPFFISLDADSILQKDSLSNIVVPLMEDEKTIAVGGNIKVSNQVVLENGEVKKVLTPKKWIVLCQMIEYYRVFLTTRVGFNRFNGNLIISGAFGLFKKEAVTNVGGYDVNSIGEDMALVIKMHSFYRKNQLEYNIEYAPNAICWTEVPDKLKDLKSQRKRWHIGLMQSILDHKYIFLNSYYGLVGTFSFLYYSVYEMISCLLEIVGVTFISVAYYLGFINIQFFMLFMITYIGYSFITSIAAIIIESYLFKNTLTVRGIFKLIIFSFVESFGYRQLTSLYRILAILQYRKSKNKWGEMSRRQNPNLNSSPIEFEENRVSEIEVSKALKRRRKKAIYREKTRHRKVYLGIAVTSLLILLYIVTRVTIPMIEERKALEASNDVKIENEIIFDESDKVIVIRDDMVIIKSEDTENKSESEVIDLRETVEDTKIDDKHIVDSLNNEYRTYTLKQGETLYSVSMKFFGTKEKIDEIVELNNIVDIYDLSVGTVLKLPE